MGTRASIIFRDEWDEFFVYRGHDGYPENIIRDIEQSIETAEGRWSGSECGAFVTLFLSEHFNIKSLLPDYELTTSIHGDESYHYTVEWNGQKWIVSCLERE
jgi:hypothetical protein